MTSQTADGPGQTPESPPTAPPPTPNSRLQGLKRFIWGQKWLSAAFLTLLPLIGTLVGGWVTWYAGADQAQKNFTQSQQKESYAAFDSAIDGFREGVWAAVRLYGSPGIPDSPLAPPVKENIGEGATNLLFAESKITFYGTDEAHKMADEVVRQMWLILGLVRGFIGDHPNYPHLSDAESCDFSAFVGETHTLIYQDLRDAQANFRDVARKDLGLQPLPRDSYDPLSGPPLHATAAAVPPPSAVPAPAPPSAVPAPGLPRCITAVPRTSATR